MFVFSCLSGSGRDGGAHAYCSSDFDSRVEHGRFLLSIGRRMRFYCFVSLCFVCVVCGFGDLVGMFMFIACKVVRWQNVCDYCKAESRMYV